MSVATWSDPPPIGGPHSPQAKWMERLRPVMKEPGRWAVIASGTPSNMNAKANTLRLRQVHVPPGDWEFTVRTFRRGVHVGDMNVAQLYARYLGASLDHISYQVAADAVWNDDGERVCPECGEALPTPVARGGRYSRKCDLCWSKVKSRWARRRLRRLQEAAGGLESVNTQGADDS